MLFGDDQQMDGSGGMDILEDLDSLVFKNSGRWYVVSDDLAENTVIHDFFPSKVFRFQYQDCLRDAFSSIPERPSRLASSFSTSSAVKPY